MLGDALAPADQRTIDNFFNKANLVIPGVNQPFGNAGRNTVGRDPFFQFDLGVHKQFVLPFRESTRLEIRGEFFNLFNKTNFQAANSDRSSAAFGTIRSTFPARQIQVAIKLYF
jgi:hypothetical protein